MHDELKVMFSSETEGGKKEMCFIVCAKYSHI